MPAAAPPTIQGALALDLGRVPPTQGRPPTGPVSPPDAGADPRLRAWAARLAQAVVETATLHRPVAQLLRWTSADVFRDLERRTHLLRRSLDHADPACRPTRPQVRSVHLSCPGDGVAEVSVHIRDGRRSRALAMRLEQREDRWLCTALEFG